MKRTLIGLFKKGKGLEEFFENSRFLSMHNCDPASKAPYQHGRGWCAAELRRKSFDDLHKLWYVLLKEKNVLLTQQQEANRIGVHWLEEDRLGAIYQSMARLKTVLTERKLAFQQARQSVEHDKMEPIEIKKAAYIEEMMQIKQKRHGFRRLLRFILRKHPHFD